MNGRVEVLHDKVWILQGDVISHQVEQEPGRVVVLRVHVALESGQHGGLEHLVLGPRAARARQVLGHLQTLGLFQNLPREEVGEAGRGRVRDQVAEQALPDALEEIGTLFKEVLKYSHSVFKLSL